MNAIISKVLNFKCIHLFGTFLSQVKLSKKIINSYHGRTLNEEKQEKISVGGRMKIIKYSENSEGTWTSLPLVKGEMCL